MRSGPFDSSRTDEFVLRYYAEADPIVSNDVIDAILESIDRWAGPLLPQTVTVDTRKERYSREAAKKLFHRQADGAWELCLWKQRESPMLSLTLGFTRFKNLNFRLRWAVRPFEFYRDQQYGRERTEQLLSFVRDMVRLIPPSFVMGHSEADDSIGKDPFDPKVHAPPDVSEMYWLNIYGRDIIEKRGGRERVLSTPACLVEELPHGSILILTRPTVADFESEESRVAQAKALVHLRPDLPFDVVLAGLRQRSATLAPVERDWDEDMVELLEFTLDKDLLFHERQQGILRLNSYRPPPVAEWCSINEAPPGDAGDDFSVLTQRLFQLGEQLLALLHGKTIYKDTVKGRPTSLADVDFHFWSYDYPDSSERTKIDSYLVPAVGGFLGSLLVTYLGGRWIPRRVLTESYVALGDRAWFPFLRARRYLESKQSVLDYSLSKFYREAERYVRSASHPG